MKPAVFRNSFWIGGEGVSCLPRWKKILDLIDSYLSFFVSDYLYSKSIYYIWYYSYSPLGDISYLLSSSR